jgi:CP family cyanate transporter-like MFS transporter
MIAPASEAEDPSHAGSSPLRWWMLAGVWLIYMCFGLTASSLAPLVAPIIRDLGLTHTQMGSVLGAWQLAFIVSAIPCGIIVDRLRPRRALLVGALLIALSGVARSFSADYLTLFLAAALFGVGGPIVSTGAPKVVSQWFTGNERGFAMGIYISGPFAGGVITLVSTNSVMMPLFDGNWRAVLLTWAALAAVSGVIWLFISSTREAREREASLEAGTKVPTTTEIATLLAMRPVQLLLVIAVSIFMINHGFSNWLPEILRAGRMDAATAGYYAAFPTIIAVIGSLIIPRFAVPARRVMILALLATSSAAGTLLLLIDTGPLLVLGLFLQGISRGAMMTVAMLLLIELPAVGDKRVGTASGLFFSFAEVGGVGGPFTLGLLYDLTHGFTAGLLMLTGFAVTILVCLFALRPYLGAKATEEARARPAGTR